jgi:flagellar biosynthesis/type III secretory pathway protein FliH
MNFDEIWEKAYLSGHEDGYSKGKFEGYNICYNENLKKELEERYRSILEERKADDKYIFTVDWD